ncbi:MAG: CobW family GTP-binding protein, partial [Bacilli bacterium]
VKLRATRDFNEKGEYMKQVEVYILAGWLGSGKTTLLQRLLIEEHRRGRKVAILMNEFGSVSIDTTILPSDVPMKELIKGCICCTLKDDLEIQLLSLIQQHEPDVIYVETTGIAHPLDVLDACLSPMMTERIAMKGIVSVLDATLFYERETQSDEVHSLLLEQVKHADYIIMNKVSELAETARGQVDWDVAMLNRYAPLEFCDWADASLEQIASLQGHVSRPEFERDGERKKVKAKSFVHSLNKPLNRERWDQLLKNIPGNIWRMKGYVTFSDNPEQRYLFQYAYRKVTYTEEMMRFPLQIVVIGESVDVESISNLLLGAEQNH